MTTIIRRLCVVTLTLILFACNKELSMEGGDGNPPPVPVDSLYQWRFKDSGATDAQFRQGFTDTAYVESEGTLSALFYEGSTADRTKGIVLQVINDPLGPGDYSGEQVSFGYFEGSSLVYTNIGANSDFTLKISVLTADSVAGTFSGHVLNSAGELKLIQSGSFQGKIGGTTQNNDSVGNLICSSLTLNGDYKPGIENDLNNYVDVQVHVTKPGTYLLETPVVNGMFFSNEQTFADTGTFDMRLSAYGTPELAGSFDYSVTFGKTTCTFNLTIDPEAETIVDGKPGSLARQIRETGLPATDEMKYYQTKDLIGEIQSLDNPVRKVFYNSNNQLSTVEVWFADGSGGTFKNQTRKYHYNATGDVVGITEVDENGNFIDSISSLSYFSSDKIASRTVFNNGSPACQLQYNYDADGNIVKIVKTNASYTSVADVFTFAFKPIGNGFSTLHPQFYFLDMATFYEEGNFPEVLYFSKQLPISRTNAAGASTPVDVIINPSLLPLSVSYGGTVWYRYEYN